MNGRSHEPNGRSHERHDKCMRTRKLVVRVESKTVTFCQKIWADFQTTGVLGEGTSAKKRPLEAEAVILETDINKGKDGRRIIRDFFAVEVPRRYYEAHEKDRKRPSQQISLVKGFAEVFLSFSRRAATSGLLLFVCAKSRHMSFWTSFDTQRIVVNSTEREGERRTGFATTTSGGYDGYN